LQLPRSSNSGICFEVIWIEKKNERGPTKKANFASSQRSTLFSLLFSFGLWIGGFKTSRWTDLFLPWKGKRNESYFSFLFLKRFLSQAGLYWNTGDDRLGPSVSWVRELYKLWVSFGMKIFDKRALFYMSILSALVSSAVSLLAFDSWKPIANITMILLQLYHHDSHVNACMCSKEITASESLPPRLGIYVAIDVLTTTLTLLSN